VKWLVRTTDDRPVSKLRGETKCGRVTTNGKALNLSVRVNVIEAHAEGAFDNRV
jgi:hypothetical protein